MMEWCSLFSAGTRLSPSDKALGVILMYHFLSGTLFCLSLTVAGLSIHQR